VIVRKAVLVPLLVAAVAGCSGGDPEVVVPPPLPEITAQPTPSATPTPAVLPSAARQATPQGAEAFARYYYATLSRAFSTGETTALRTLATSGCQTCARFANSIDASTRSGQRFAGGQITVRAAAAVKRDASLSDVTLRYDSAPLRLLSADGAELRQRAAQLGVTVEMQLRAGRNGWLVDDIQLLQS
jgi:hypothetical protein